MELEIGALDEHYSQLDVVELDEGLARLAGELAESERLRGYDAVHLAAASRLDDVDLVVVAGDRDLLAAAAKLGLHVATVG